MERKVACLVDEHVFRLHDTSGPLSVVRLIGEDSFTPLRGQRETVAGDRGRRNVIQANGLADRRDRLETLEPAIAVKRRGAGAKAQLTQADGDPAGSRSMRF